MKKRPAKKQPTNGKRYISAARRKMKHRCEEYEKQLEVLPFLIPEDRFVIQDLAFWLVEAEDIRRKIANGRATSDDVRRLDTASRRIQSLSRDLGLTPQSRLDMVDKARKSGYMLPAPGQEAECIGSNAPQGIRYSDDEMEGTYDETAMDAEVAADSVPAE